MTLTLDTPLAALHEYLPRVGPKTAQKIAAEFAVLRGAATLDAATVEDLAFYLPFRYEDRSHLPKIDSLRDGLSAAVEVEIRTPTNFPVRTKAGRQLTIFEFSGRDETGQIRAHWWNQPYLLQTFKAGRRVILFGEWKFSNRHNCFQIENAEYEILSDSDDDDVASDAVGMIHVGRRTPIYRKLGVLRTRALRTLMFHVLERLEAGGGENLPNDLAARCGTLSRIDALRRVHFPENDAPLEDYQRGRSPAHARLAFEEFFLLSLAMLARREGRMHDARPAAMQMTERIRDRIQESLPFTPTEAQRRVVREIIADMTGARPMSRLLQGDVGAGKTVVALQAMIVAVENGYQAALMAPTEILAEQHTLNLKRWLRHAPYRIVTLTGRARASEKRAIRAAVAAGEFDIVIGTQALIQDGVEFSRLGLAVIDEQHRFGVMQRERLVRGGLEPGVLVMTATPIPRSLAMSLYGDLDVSALDELPPGRQPVRTVIRTAAERGRVHDFIRAEAAAGRQAYIVFPLVAESEKSDLAAAVQAAEELQNGVFRDLRVGLLHGRMKPAEKEATMSAFAAGEYQVLVSTTVIEVGIDVPNASVMVIEGPERFGLAQLHQLRGRIGRGAAKSYCVLMASGKRTPDAEARMKILCETQDGFVIAEKDLELRGPGEMLGVRQSGIPLFRVGNIVRDRDWLEAARDAARRVMSERRHSLEVVRWLEAARRIFPDPGVGAH